MVGKWLTMVKKGFEEIWEMYFEQCMFESKWAVGTSALWCWIVVDWSSALAMFDGQGCKRLTTARWIWKVTWLWKLKHRDAWLGRRFQRSGEDQGNSQWICVARREVDGWLWKRLFVEKMRLEVVVRVEWFFAIAEFGSLGSRFLRVESWMLKEAERKSTLSARLWSRYESRLSLH